MARLEYSVYVAPRKPAVSDSLPHGEARRMWRAQKRFKTVVEVLCAQRGDRCSRLITGVVDEW
jgi:hypothetical protein